MINDHAKYLELAEKCGLIDKDPVNPASEQYIKDLLCFADMVAQFENDECYYILNAYTPDDNSEARNLMCIAGHKMGSRFTGERGRKPISDYEIDKLWTEKKGNIQEKIIQLVRDVEVIHGVSL